MKKTFKRFMAFVMTGVLLASPMSALAAGTTPDATTSPAVGSADASGDVEGFVDTTIFKVVLPTSAEGTFDFIMDPQGLIAATSGDAYTNANFDDNATVFFNTASADASGDYKSQSRYIEVLNRGTVAVNVSVEAKVTGLSTIKMASGESSFTSGDAAVPELYLAFTASGDASGDAKTAPVAITTTGTGTTAKTSATIKAVLPAASDDKYEFNYASGNYTYDLKDAYASGDADDFSDYSFALTGACNTEADWTAVKDAAPAVNVVWTLTDADSIPTFASGADIVINYSGTAPTASNATFTSPSGKTFAVAAKALTNGNITVNTTASTVTIKRSWITGLNTETGTFKLTIAGTDYKFILQ